MSDLMWALETLAWSPDWLPRVTHVLARLDAIDVKPRKYVNGPLESLKTIYVLWVPHTNATQAERLRAIDLIRKREPAAAWKLMLGVLPSGHDISSPPPLPRWRDFSVDGQEVVTWSLIGRGAAELTTRLVTDVGNDPQRWITLLDRLGDLSPDADGALATLDAAERQMTDADDRGLLWEKLRRLLHHHRQFPDAEWSLKEDVLQRLEAIYERFAPTNPLARTAWLFAPSVALPKPPSKGWEAVELGIQAARREAARALFQDGGVPAILDLARQAGSPGYIGLALYECELPAADLDAVIEAAARSDDGRERDVAHGLIASTFPARKETWAESLLARARSECWGDDAVMTILCALPAGRWTWERVAEIGGETLASYWRRAPVFWMDGDCGDAVYAVSQLIAVGRARHALALVGRRDDKRRLPSAVLLEVLEQAAGQPVEPSNDGNDAVMFQYYVAETLTELDERDDVDRSALAGLEWLYLRILKDSRRPPKVLLTYLSESPEQFIEILRAVYMASPESGVEEPDPLDPEHARAVASQAYRLLDIWDRIPGARHDGTIDSEALETWINKARALAEQVGRTEVADSRIGRMLSASPKGTDGHWPAEAVRDVLDLFRSKPMLDGFQIGKANRRGITTRMPGDDGELERIEAAKYRGWAKAIAFEHPRTAKALSSLADGYELDARREDERVERRDWA